MTSVHLLLCGSRPGFLGSLGRQLSGHCKLLECYSTTEVAQLARQHELHVIVVDLRSAPGRVQSRIAELRHRCRSAQLIVVTSTNELLPEEMSAEIGARITLIKVAEDDANLIRIAECAKEILRGLAPVTQSATEASDAEVQIPLHNRTQSSETDKQCIPPLESVSIAERYRTSTPVLQGILNRLEVAARHEVTILLIGETGSGKTHLARLIHESSSRKTGSLLTVACGALPGELIESELFGHAKGAFTGAHADKDGKFIAAGCGTILLDEIDVLTPDQQVKLLRVIEQGLFEPVGSNRTIKVNARIIAASNLDLEPLVESGRFRADLYYRLNTLSFTIPPLRERLPDIEVLARHFVQAHSERHNIEIVEINQSFIDSLIRYPWPGNVREMENAIRSAVIYSQHGRLTADTLPANIVAGSAGPVNNRSVNPFFSGRKAESLGNRIELTEKEIIHQALLSNSFSRTQTAKQLGISRVTLYNKMKKYGMMPHS